MYTFSWIGRNFVYQLKKVALYQLKKVDTEKIFQLNNFSKVDNSDIFV